MPATGNRKHNLLVLDQGTHSSRALLMNSKGDVLEAVSVPVTINYPQAGYAEQSPQQILQSINIALEQLASRIGEPGPGFIDHALLIVQRSSFLACRKGRLDALTPVISWQDTRHQQLIDKLTPDDKKHIKRTSGLRANAHYGASKMRWLLDNDAEIRQHLKNNTLVFVPLAAFLAFHLAGSLECVVDPVIASRTLLTGLGELCWNKSLLQMFDIDECCLPRIVPTEYDFGEITLGSQKIPLSLVGGDQSLIPFAAGVPIDHHRAYVNVGTGAFVQMPVAECNDIQDLLYSPLALSEENRVLVLEGTVNAAATALDWLWSDAGVQLALPLINQALSTENHPPLFINTLAGTGSPFWLPARAPYFIGTGLLPAKAVAVLESIVFALMDNIHFLQQANPYLAGIMIGGGLSLFDGFCQKLSNISGLEVTRLNTHEVSARGAAFYFLKKNRVAVHRDSMTFSPLNDEPLNKRYATYQHAMQQLLAAL